MGVCPYPLSLRASSLRISSWYGQHVVVEELCPVLTVVVPETRDTEELFLGSVAMVVAVLCLNI